VWSIPTEAREKSNAGELVLPDAAVAIIKKQPPLHLTLTSLPVAMARTCGTFTARVMHSGLPLAELIGDSMISAARPRRLWLALASGRIFPSGC
jgi:hypothetical protein